MEIQIKEDSGVTVICPVGRIDTSTAKAFEEGVMKIVPNSRLIVISFTGIDYISSAGLRVILMAGKKIAAAKGQFALADMSKKIAEVFRMSGFDKILKIYDTLDQAKASFVA